MREDSIAPKVHLVFFIPLFITLIIFWPALFLALAKPASSKELNRMRLVGPVVVAPSTICVAPCVSRVRTDGLIEYRGPRRANPRPKFVAALKRIAEKAKTIIEPEPKPRFQIGKSLDLPISGK